MMRIRNAVLIASLMTAVPALAGEYPFSGYLTIAGDPEKADPLDTRRCALNFFRQGTDGGFTGYHVDLQKFQATREVNYVVYQRGICAYDEKAKIESCNMAYDTDKDSQGNIYVDVLESVGDAYVRTMSFEDVAQAEVHIVVKHCGSATKGRSAVGIGKQIQRMAVAFKDLHPGLDT